MVSEKILQQGAEAVIFLKEDFVVKKRISKSYRIKEIDEKIRKLRTRGEGKLLERASEVVNIPKFIRVNEKEKIIEMEFINGKKLSDNLDEFDLKKQKEICKIIGGYVGKLHDARIIHGDLTTSNIIFKDEVVYFIDFGLGFISHKIEDKAVDLHVFKQALEAKHFENWKLLFEEFVKEYEKSEEGKSVLERLKKVERRGRYKH
jgi:TP53 regulating kinase and related kinases